MARRGVAPPAGERMAREQPALHFLYRAIANASNAFDREELRERLACCNVQAGCAGRFRDAYASHLRWRGYNLSAVPSDALAQLMPNARVEHVPETGHSVYFQRPEIFNQLVNDFLSRVG